MPASPSIPDRLRYAPFRATEVVAAGLLTRRQLRGASWRRMLPDVYAYAGLQLDHRAWCYAAGLLLDGRGAVSGRSAAYLWGADVLPTHAPAEVTVPPDVQLLRRPGLAVRRSPLPLGDVRHQAGTPVTTPLRTAFDLCRRGDLVEAVVGLDAMLARRLVQVDDVRRFAASRSGWPGLRQLTRVLDLADGRAESPMETRTRLALVTAGLPRPACQYEVYDAAGFFVARLDLAYPEHRLAIEYEGDHHRGRGVFAHDLRRLNALHALGWSVLRFGADDVLRHPGRMVAQVSAALASRPRRR